MELQLPNRPTTPATWEDYAKTTADAMGKLARHEIDVSSCYDSLPSKPDFVREDVHDFIGNIVEEAEGFHLEFEKLHELLGQGATQQQLVEFINWVG